VESTFSYSV